MDITYRPNAPADAPAIRELQDKLFPGHGHDYSNGIGHPLVPGFVAVSGVILLGFITARTFKEEHPSDQFWEYVSPYIRFMGVEPHLQRRGLGRKLVAMMCDHLRQQCVARCIYLECNREQAGFYEKCGFVEMSEAEVMAIAGKKLGSRVPFRKHCTEPLRYSDVL
jgi:ribosomal protein S18 acetylase RimI-like enzyme